MLNPLQECGSGEMLMNLVVLKWNYLLSYPQFIA